MIKPESFSKDWIESFRKQKQYAKISPGHLEKMIHALALIEQLTLQGFDFVFKGGTSLILILKEALRFSIDVDIITSITHEQLEKHLDKVIENSHFTKWELDTERSFKNKIPKGHYYIYFDSLYTSEASFILLDVIFDENSYTNTQEVKVISKWLQTDEPVQTVKVPTQDAILGDKLTAFAPSTIGIPYKNNKDMEIIKQLFDVYQLIAEQTNPENVLRNYEAVAKKQISYHEMTITHSEVLQDTIDTAIILAKREKNIGDDKIKFDELQDGIKKFKNQLMTGNFNIEQAQVASARAAYISSKLKTNDLTHLEIYSDKSSIEKLNIENQNFGFLQRFKKTNPEAFFYWYYALNGQTKKEPKNS
jgi:predicted nucleotidyltransferase component of viral defense system